ncbi:T9SS type A sorting domain-containing protein [Corallibacter sp.]|uniref:T9SS type A sorting domain-containing protein n=1 Tax=Corallibacter sp. TaxID=2038084 RepID=UPI003AB11D51
MKPLKLFVILMLLSFKSITAQTVTASDYSINATPTYTFTYVTDRPLGAGTGVDGGYDFTDIFVTSILPSGYPLYNGGENLSAIPDIVVQIDGVTQNNSDFSRISSYFGSWIAISTSVIYIPAGSTITVIIPNFITNPSIGGTYTYEWRTTDASGHSPINFSANINIDETLGTDSFQLREKHITVFPNPSSDYIKISGLTTSESYSVYNLLGAEVKRGTIVADEKINIQNLKNGVYFVKLENDDSFRFIKN